MTRDRSHYDGESPREPLSPDHFSEAEQREGSQLGDGSPGVPRRKQTKGDDAAKGDEAPPPA